MGTKTMGKLACALIFVCCGAVFGCSDKAEDPGGPGTQGDGDGDGDQGEPGVCRDNDDCSDEVFCNGEERCNPDHEGADAFGCIEAEGQPCGAGNSCNEAGDSCGCEEPDADGDGFESRACGGDDCDDDDANRYPGNEETCDSEHHDEDCDPSTYGFRDQDGDDDPDDECCNEDESGDLICGTDCNDNRGNQHSFNTEICDDVDNDCDGLVDETIDGDEDDGLKVVFTIDQDGDGRGSAAEDADTVFACDPPEGYVETSDDCDDDDNQVSPESTEVCDDVDNDCDGLTDESIDGDEDDGLKIVFTVDADGDGFGSSADDAETILACNLPSSGYSMSASDCDDAVAAVNPGAIDSCNDDVDNDCSGVVNDPVGGCSCEGNATQSCAASGSVGKCATFTQQCSNGVWGDCPLGLNSEPEVCDAIGVDENCDGIVNNSLGSNVTDSLKVPYYRDRDGDGYPDLSTSQAYCPDLEPAGWTTDENPNDCVDVLLTTNPLSDDIHPGAVEVCNGLDDDCDNTADDVADLESAPSPPNVSALMCGGSDGWEITGCSGSYLDCQQASISDGCETLGNTLENCGACGNSCSLSCNSSSCDEVSLLSLGSQHTCAIAESGFASCWGANTSLQLGSGNSSPIYYPTVLSALTGTVSDISAGPSHTCAISGTSGGVFCWGSNENRKMGAGSAVTGANQPVAVPNVAGEGGGSLVNATAIAVGNHHSCAIWSGGAVGCWGLQSDYRLATGLSSPASPPVTAFRDPSNPSAIDDAVRIDAGFSHTCIINSSDTVECWGDNSLGQLGDGNSPTDPLYAVGVSSLSNVGDLALGNFHSCALSGTNLYCWGSNSNRQLGLNSGTSSYDTPQLIRSDVLDVAAGAGFTCVVTLSGAVQCWGANSSGQRGDTNYATSTHEPTTLSSLGTAIAVYAGADYACARLETAGEVRCWGNNSGGQLGIGSADANPHPTPQSLEPLSE